ncbi:MAG: LUD domain-containing protein [Caulobacteraceae bacterium]|nr:LUD domain-containing protein [Caulobacteraceae bacterium]
MSARDAILERIRSHRPSGEHPLPESPDFTRPSGDVQARFVERLERMGGEVLPPDGSGDMLAPLRTRLAAAGRVCSAAPEIEGNVDLDAIARPHDLADVDISVARAAFGVAETGSVLFTEAELRVNAMAYLAQHLVVLVDPADIVESTQHAYRSPLFHQARYVACHSGPSATADIEGVLIHGAQGVRSLTVVFVPRSDASLR